MTSQLSKPETGPVLALIHNLEERRYALREQGCTIAADELTSVISKISAMRAALAIPAQQKPEASPVQHFNLPKGKPAQFVRNGRLETCQCRECIATVSPHDSASPQKVKTSIYESAVQGRADFRDAYREALAKIAKLEAEKADLVIMVARYAYRAEGGADPLAALVARFSAALLEKLKAAREKYGHDEEFWQHDHWEADCQRQLLEHLAKGDPRDVAAYCAFMWHHGWKTVAALCPCCGGSRVEQIDGGNGNVFDQPCSVCTTRHSQEVKAEGDKIWVKLPSTVRIRPGPCTTDDCLGRPEWRLEAGGVSSVYCSDCKAKIDVRAKR